MAPFYSRFVPKSGNSAAKSVNLNSFPPSKKRKLDDEQARLQQDIKIGKKTIREPPRIAQKGVERSKDSADGKKTSFESRRNGSENIFHKVAKVNGSPKAGDDEGEFLALEGQFVGDQEKRRRAQHVQTKDEALNASKVTQDPKQQGSEVDNEVKAESGKEKKKKKRQKTKEIRETVSEDTERVDTEQDQHGTIRSKFEKATKNTVESPPSHFMKDIL